MSLKNPDTATRFVWKLWPKGLDSSIRGPKHQPETPDWWMPTLKYTFSISLPLFSSKLLKQTLGPPGTSPPCKSTKLCCVMRGEVKRRALSYVPSLCWTKKRSDGIMVEKHSPSQRDSAYLRKETVSSLCFWTLLDSSTLDPLCPKIYTFCFSFLSHCCRNEKASVKCLCLTFLRWVYSSSSSS